MSELIIALRRFWQPRHPLFWLAVTLQLLSSFMTTALYVRDIEGPLRWVLSVCAVINTLASWWLFARIWREAAPPAAESGMVEPVERPLR
ncbi:hypothetical protein [Hydrogenophaga sp. NFH-34]|uniref:hypothetical protein n=1 Tax=Hydrogenophaga sp. NFH-34 TaxID=2744446 RepID=UPI001F3418C4|nr:hypothetical protein [Hydrogenophaga sp. NFH-34]